MKTILATGAVSRLGTTVRDARRRLHLTQAELAEQAQVSRTFVIDLERGHERAELGKVIAVLGALNLELSADAHTPEAQELSAVERAEALGEVIDGWREGQAVPDKATQSIVKQYVVGKLSVDEAIEHIDRLPVPATQHLSPEFANALSVPSG